MKKRSNCPISSALEILGDKWTLLIIRDALFRQRTTFGEFRSSPEHIASNILAARLQKLVELGIFKKIPDKEHKLKIHYQLTKKGRDLKDVLLAVGSWGHKHLDNTLDMLKKIKMS